MSRCKAPVILRSEAYIQYVATTKDEGNARRWAFFNNLHQDSTRTFR
jgi:hypothetical protein